MDLDKKFLPKHKTTIAWKPIYYAYYILVSVSHSTYTSDIAPRGNFEQVYIHLKTGQSLVIVDTP